MLALSLCLFLDTLSFYLGGLRVSYLVWYSSLTLRVIISYNPFLPNFIYTERT